MFNAADVFKCFNLSDLVLEGNAIAKEGLYRPIIISLMKKIKSIDGKRIYDEERRNSVKMIKKQEEKRKEALKQYEKGKARESALSECKLQWESMNSVDSLESVTKPIFSGYSELENGRLRIVGDSPQSLEKNNPAVTSIIFEYINSISKVISKLESKFVNLQAIRFSSNNINQLGQLDCLSSLRIMEIDISSEGNAITRSGLLRQYLMFVMRNSDLKVVNGIECSERDKSEAISLFSRFKFKEVKEPSTAIKAEGKICKLD